MCILEKGRYNMGKEKRGLTNKELGFVAGGKDECDVHELSGEGGLLVPTNNSFLSKEWTCPICGAKIKQYQSSHICTGI